MNAQLLTPQRISQKLAAQRKRGNQETLKSAMHFARAKHDRQHVHRQDRRGVRLLTHSVAGLLAACEGTRGEQNGH